MHRSLISSGLAGLALATFIGSGAIAETVTYKATMNAQTEVPPNESKGAGTAEITYDTTTKMLTWTVTFSDLSGPPTAAHFHGPAEAGKNAGVAVPILVAVYYTGSTETREQIDAAHAEIGSMLADTIRS